MASTYYLVEDPREETSAALAWFRGLTSPPREVSFGDGLWLQFGPLSYGSEEEINVDQSPLVSLFPARILCGVLWSATEIHFRAKGSSPGGKILSRVQKDLKNWLGQQEVVFEQLPAPASPFAYYLEGGLQNIAQVIYASASGAAALRRGQYFVAHTGNETNLDRLCRMLKLRGVDCNCDSSS